MHSRPSADSEATDFLDRANSTPALPLLISKPDPCPLHPGMTQSQDRQINLSEVVNGQVFCNFSSVVSVCIWAK